MGGGDQAPLPLDDRLRVLDALYIPTRYPDRAPTDHFGRLQSDDALVRQDSRWLWQRPGLNPPFQGRRV